MKIVHPECEAGCTHAYATAGPNPVPPSTPVYCGPSGFLPPEPGQPVAQMPEHIPFSALSYSPTTDPVVQAYPEPEVRSTDGLTGPEKRAVQDLDRYAQDQGWETRVTYARGCMPHATHGTPGPVADSLAVRMRRGQDYAVAVYLEAGSTWKWTAMFVIKGGVRTPYPSITALRAALSDMEG